MKKMKPKEVLMPALALFIICLVVTVILALTNGVTAPKIAENDIKTANESLNLVLSEVDGKKVTSFSDAKDVTVDSEDGKKTVSVQNGLDKDGKTLGLVVTSASKGYGGDVKVMVGFKPDGTIVGFTVLDCSNETPGLGQNSKTDSFMQRFIDKKGELTVNKNSNEGQNIQAITAATITSKAVVRAVNAATNAVKEEGGQKNG